MLLQLNKNNWLGSTELILKKFCERYIDLVNSSNLIDSKYPDKLLEIPKIKNGIFSIKLKLMFHPQIIQHQVILHYHLIQ